MGWPIVAAAAISAIGSMAASRDGGESSTSTTVSPAPWDADSKRFWDEFMDNWFGTSMTTGDIDPTHYYRINEDGSYQDFGTERPYNYNTPTIGTHLGGMHEGEEYVIPGEKNYYDDVFTGAELIEQGLVPTEETPSYKDMFLEDFEYLKDAGQNFIDTMSGYTEYRQSKVDEATNNYVDTLTRLENNEDGYLNPINITFGNNAFNLIPKRGLAATELMGDLAKDKYTGSLTGTELYAKAGEDQAGRELNIAEKNTPNAGQMAYMGQLMEQANKLNALRYGLESSSTTSSETPSLLESINAGLETGSSVYDIISAWQAGEEEEE